jgi:uncharacterized membrane protein
VGRLTIGLKIGLKNAVKIGRTTFALGLALAVAAVATLVGAVLLWPPHPHIPVPPNLSSPAHVISGTVIEVTTYPCADFIGGTGATAPQCETAQVVVHSGPDKGQIESIDQAGEAGIPTIRNGDHVLLVRAIGPNGKASYGFYDFQRGTPLALLALAFAIIVVLVGRWRGLGALVGLGVTWLVMVRFVLPAVLEGKDPLSVSLVGAAIIVLVVLFIAHGVSNRTMTAVLGTLASLAIVDVLARIVVHAAALSGLASEESQYLQSVVGDVRVQGLLLGGIVIGSLGVLNDVTVTQASAVWEIHEANPSRGTYELYRSGMRVGRDHIASTVYTLVLAYAGAALPTLLLFSLAGQRLGSVVTGEQVAEEVVRTLVGGIGLALSVPLTTGLAAFVVTRSAQERDATLTTNVPKSTGSPLP